MGLLERVAAARGAQISRGEGPLDPADYWFNYGGYSYFGTPSTAHRNSEGIESDFQGLVQQAYKQNTVIWSVERARLSVFSEARFQFRQIRGGRPGDYFGTPALTLLEKPWTNGTTGDLLTRMLQEADFAGNAFYTERGGMMRRMRPDWVNILMGSNEDPSVSPSDLDAELIGYAYWPGGHLSGRDPVVLLPDEVAHFAPIPDPMAWYRGMSWLTPVIREIMSDNAATEHKLAFFRNGATPQVVVSLDKDIKQEAFERLQRKMNNQHQGASNAYRTMYIGGGADVTVVGADLKQLDFKATQGAGESRIAAAAGVHPTIVGLSEGLQGSSLNAGNFGQARRLFSEGTLSMLWRNVAASLSTLVPPPAGSELWCDTRDVPFLREDQSDVAAIESQEATTISTLINAGYKPDSVVAAVMAKDWTLLVHTGLYSVQLQPPGTAGTMNGPPTNGTPVNGGGVGPKVPSLRASSLVRFALPGRVIDSESSAQRHFDPGEPRDPLTGEWGHGTGIGKDLKKAGKALEGQAALDATPAKLTRAPGGHSGDYTGEKLAGPKGIGTARALSEYQGVEYADTNSALRSGHMDSQTAHRVANIDQTMAASRLTSDVRVHRIVQKGSSTFGRDAWFGHVVDWNSDDFDKQDREVENWEAGARPDLTGLRWSDAAYASTTVDPKAAEEFGGRWRSTNSALDGEPVIMSIHVPAGTGGVQLSEIGHEAEILLERGLTMEVVADHGVGPDGFRRLDVKVVPIG